MMTPVSAQKQTCSTFGRNSKITEMISFQAAYIVLNTSANAPIGRKYYTIAKTYASS